MVKKTNTLESFIDLFENPLYNEVVDRETRNRIKICVAAYAYEFLNDPIISDSDYDKLACSIDTTINTRRPDLDKWFRKEFGSYTGSWINTHPELHKIANIYGMYRKK